MLSFATELPIAPERSTADLMALARRWVAGSPHVNVLESALPVPKEGELLEVTVDGRHFSVGLVHTDTFSLVGFKYRWVDHGQRQWTTEIVGRKANEFWATVRVYCESLFPSPILPRARKPYIIKQIIHELGTGLDGGLTVSDKPLLLEPSELDKAAKLIKGTFGNRLPVVYVSANYPHRATVDSHELARWLAGLAHVVIEPDRAFSLRLMDAVDGRNTYAGGIGIYWPNGVGRHLRFIPRHYSSPQSMAIDTMNHIEQAMANRRPSPDCTWSFLRETLSRRAISTLRAAGSTAVEAYVAAFDAELSAKQQQLEASEQEISRLRAEIVRLETPSQGHVPPLLEPGKERDLYPGERRSFLVQALREGLKSVPADSRRSHIVEDILQANDEDFLCHALAEQLKETLRGYTSLGKRERKAMEDIGFEISEAGKHHKAVFRGDGRYTFALAKTPSDHRTGLNTASTIKKKLF